MFYPHPSLAWEISPNEINVDFINSFRTKDPWNQTELPIYVQWERNKGVENFTKYMLLASGQSLVYTIPSASYHRLVAEDTIPDELEISCNAHPLAWKNQIVLLNCGENLSSQVSLRIYNPTNSEIAIPFIQILPKEATRIETKVKNIIFIVIDSLRYDAIGKEGVTPNLDRFQKQSVSFHNHLVNAAWTRPSTTIFFTGKYASKSPLNFWDYPLPKEEARAFYENKNLPLPIALSNFGYHSTMIGNNPFVTDRFGIGVDYGFLSVAEYSRSPNDTLLIKERALQYFQKIHGSPSRQFLF